MLGAKNGELEVTSKDVPPSCQDNQMAAIFGFDWNDLKSWDSFTRCMCKPLDPASLGILRILFGEFDNGSY